MPTIWSVQAASAAGSSGATPRSEGSPPQVSTMAASATVLELTICVGGERLAGHDQLVAGREQGDARPPADRQPGAVEGRGKAEIARAQATAGGQGELALAEVEAGRADEGAGLDPTLEPDPVGRDDGVLLQRDRIAASRQRAAGEDAHGLARPERPLEAAARGRLADQAQLGAAAGQVGGAHRVAVHRRDRLRRLIARGDQVLRQDPAMGGRQMDPLGRLGLKRGGDPRQGLIDGQHQPGTGISRP